MKAILFIISFLIGGVLFGQTTIPFSSTSNNQTFSTCNGFIIDSGGQGGPGYSNGENTTITICPGVTGNIISIVFNLFQLSTTDDNPLPNVTNVDYMDVYDGNSTAAPTLGTYSGTQLQGVVISATPFNTTGCITLRFRSNTIGTGMFSASATCTTPCATPTANGVIVGGETADSTRVCVGEVVNFANNLSTAATGFTLANYYWDFMDGTGATGQTVSHVYDTPGYYLVQLFVTDNNGCGNTNLIDLQVYVATIPNFIGFPNDTTLCLGENLQVNPDPEFSEVEWNGFDGIQTIDDGCLPDTLLGVSQDIQILQTGFQPGATITQLSDIVSFCIDLEHSFMGDLVLLVECPNGQSQIFHQQGGGGTQIGIPNPADNVDCSDPTTQGIPFTYCFTPSATDTWVTWAGNNGFGATIPAGSYAPVQPFSNLFGCPLNGIWTLTVIDNWAADDGTLFAFDINLNPSLYPPVPTFEPQIGLGSDSSYWTTPAIFATISTDGDSLSINPTAPGVYNYTYNLIDNFGCTNDSTFTLTVNANQIPDAGPDIIACLGDSVQLNGSVSGGSLSCDYTFSLEDSFGDGWNGNNLLVTINGVTTSYTIPAGDTASYTVSIPHGTQVTFQFDSLGFFVSECAYEIIDPSGAVIFSDGGNFVSPTAAIQTFTSNCFGGLVFDWSPAAILNNNTIPNPIGLFDTVGVMYLTIHPAGHPLCVTTDSLNFSVVPYLNPGNDSTLTICSQGAPTDLFPLLGTNATPNGEWTNSAGAIVMMPYDPITMNPGIYTYSVDTSGCVSTAEVVVTEIVTTVTVTPTNANCYGFANGSAAITVANGNQYSLDGGAPIAITTSPFTISNLAAGPHVIVVGGLNGCGAFANFTIDQPLPLQITTITPNLTACPEANTQITAAATGGSSPYTFTWIANNTIAGTGANFNVSPDVTTQYCVVLTEACGSQPDTACMTITVPVPVTFAIAVDDTEGCYPVPVNFTNNSTGSTIVTSQVSFGDGNSAIVPGSNSFFNEYQSPGVYSVTITSTSNQGCVYDTTYTALIEVFDNPEADFNINPNPVGMFDGKVNLYNSSSNDVVSFNWMINDGDPAQSANEDLSVQFEQGVAGNYNVTLYVTNADGCVDSITKIAQVVSEVIVFAPNTFTPDDDERNPQWLLYIQGADIMQFNLKIYNRWGEIIWENNDPSIPWDGSYKGVICPQGVYSWTLETKDITTDKRYRFDGSINLIR